VLGGSHDHPQRGDAEDRADLPGLRRQRSRQPPGLRGDRADGAGGSGDRRDRSSHPKSQQREQQQQDDAFARQQRDGQHRCRSQQERADRQPARPMAVGGSADPAREKRSQDDGRQSQGSGDRRGEAEHML
jgi:hypothetical protein